MAALYKLRDEYVVQYNLSPETHLDDYWWLDHFSYGAIEEATQTLWQEQNDNPEMGYRILHRVTQITEEIVEPAWVEEIEE